MRRRSKLAALAGSVAVMLASAAVAGAGWSAGASAGPQAVAAASLAAPGTPASSITCVPATSMSVGLSWPAAGNATSYDVLRGTTSGGPYTLIGSTDATTYSDTTVVQQKTYYYVIVAKRAAWTSATSAQVQATTPRLASCR